MQLINSSHARPVTVASLAILSLPPIAGSDFILNRGSVNTAIKNDLSQSSSVSYNQLIARAMFKRYYEEWINETVFLSNADTIVNNKNFKGIVAMGSDAVPYIIDEIIRKPSPLVWALNSIYKEKISDDPQLTIENACKLWIEKLTIKKYTPN